MKHNVLSLSKNSPRKIITSNYIIIDPHSEPLAEPGSRLTLSRTGSRSRFYTLIRSFFTVISIPAFLPSLGSLPLTPSHGRKVTGTLFGNRRGRVSFAVQHDPRSAPVLIIELAVSTANLAKEMSSGLVRIALECDKRLARGKLVSEPRWVMFCNGRRCGFASLKAGSESDWDVLTMVRSVSVGAGVIPASGGGGGGGGSGGKGEVLYMRAVFERVVGSRDSEAYYMMNPDGVGGPELSIFLLRI